MNGIHDMGGMQGFGPIPIEADEPIFHADWEAKALALRMATGAWGKWNIDAGRHSIERFASAEYLALSYYERWITSLAASRSRPAWSARRRSPAAVPIPAAKIKSHR